MMSGYSGHTGIVVKGKAICVAGMDFPGNSLLQFNLVHQKREQGYKPPFFFFITFVPAGKAGNSKTYITDKRVSFKVEYTKALEIVAAIRAHANGGGGRLGKLVIWADPTKAAHVSENTDMRTGKRMTVDSAPHARNQGEHVVRVTCDPGKDQSGASAPAIVYSMSPYEALAIADNLSFLAQQAREMHFNRMVLDSRNAAAAGRMAA